VSQVGFKGRADLGSGVSVFEHKSGHTVAAISVDELMFRVAISAARHLVSVEVDHARRTVQWTRCTPHSTTQHHCSVRHTPANIGDPHSHVEPSVSAVKYDVRNWQPTISVVGRQCWLGWRKLYKLN